MADENVKFKRVGHRSVRDASGSEDDSEAEEKATQVNTTAKETKGYVVYGIYETSTSPYPIALLN